VIQDSNDNAKTVCDEMHDRCRERKKKREERVRKRRRNRKKNPKDEKVLFYLRQAEI
jgi:hypothetical protein